MDLLPFTKYQLVEPLDVYEQLATATQFEPIINGRCSTIIVKPTDISTVPIIRSTTAHTATAQPFAPIHDSILENIKLSSTIADLEANNAMIEIYDQYYTKMKYHSDCSLDLQIPSYICLYSCYSDPNTTSLRKLKIRSKETNTISEIIMEHNSVIIFSTSTNQKYQHKIILDNRKDETRWLGITFRMSKTYITYIDELAYFTNTTTILSLADKSQIREFINYKKTQNDDAHDFIYPEIYYTVSVTDLIVPSK